MTDYIVGCDNIVGGESNLIERVCKVLESKGHTAQRLSVGPNFVQSSGLKSSSSGKVAIFIVGGSDIGTYVDFRDGIKNGYYHWKYAWFAFASWTAHSWITKEDLKNKPLVRAHDDNFSSGSSIAPYLGKSADYFFQENKQYVNYVYGQTPEELAKKILAGGGEDSDDGSSASTIKEAIKDILKMRDGEIECRVVNDTVFINKIPDPETAELSLIEGRDIIQKSINITDINPETINFLTVHWQGGEDIVFRDEKLIERFGEKKAEMDAVKRVVTTKESDSSSSNTSSTTTTTTTDNTTNTTTDTTSSDDSSSETESSVEEVPCETLEEAQTFANTEWAKIKRDNGHTIECKVIGSPLWEQGKWVRVYIPSFDEDGYMYITKCSHSESASPGWETNITLADYPPGFGEPEEAKSDEDEEESEDEETTEETTT